MDYKNAGVDIIKVTEFEEMYYDLFKNNLSKMSNLNSKN